MNVDPDNAASPASCMLVESTVGPMINAFAATLGWSLLAVAGTTRAWWVPEVENAADKFIHKIIPQWSLPPGDAEEILHPQQPRQDRRNIPSRSRRDSVGRNPQTNPHIDYYGGHAARTRRQGSGTT